MQRGRPASQLFGGRRREVGGGRRRRRRGREKRVLEGNPRAALHCSGVEAGEEDCPHIWPVAGQTGLSCEGGP